MKMTVQQQAIFDLMLEEYPAARELPKKERLHLAEVYAAEGAAGVERILVAETGGDDLPHLFIKAHGRLFCANQNDGVVHKKGERCAQLERHVA